MKLRSVSFLFAAFLVLVSVSCTQDEGFGGGSSLTGKLVTRYYNNDFTVFQGEEPAVDENIFIVFGGDSVVGDRIRSSFNGDFRFEYLWPGNYRLFYETNDSTGNSLDDISIQKSIEIKRNETLDLGILYNYKALNWNKGTAKIKGKIIEKNYKKSSVYPNLEISDIFGAQEKEVYLIYNDEDFYCERIRTQGDGTYVFSNLLIGKYVVFVYSEDVYSNSGVADIVKKATVEITQKGEVIVLDDIITDKF